MYILTDIQQPLSVFPVHQQHANIVSQIFTYQPNNRHYRVVILLTVWYCWIW